MFSYRHTIVVARDVHEVFDFVTDAAHNAAWQPGVLSAAQTTPGRVEVGSRVEEARDVLGQRIVTVYEVVDVEAPHRCEVRSIEGPLRFRARYLLESAPGHTVVTLWGQVEGCRLPGVGRLAGAVARRQVDACARRLKAVLEAPVAA